MGRGKEQWQTTGRSMLKCSFSRFFNSFKQLLIYLSYEPQDCILKVRIALYSLLYTWKKKHQLRLLKVIAINISLLSKTEKWMPRNPITFQVLWLVISKAGHRTQFSWLSDPFIYCLSTTFLEILYEFPTSYLLSWTHFSEWVSFFILPSLNFSGNLGNLKKVFLILLSAEYIHVTPFYVLVQSSSEDEILDL